eukprot:gene10733-289_t
MGRLRARCERNLHPHSGTTAAGDCPRDVQGVKQGGAPPPAPSVPWSPSNQRSPPPRADLAASRWVGGATHQVPPDVFYASLTCREPPPGPWPRLPWTHQARAHCVDRHPEVSNAYSLEDLGGLDLFKVDGRNLGFALSKRQGEPAQVVAVHNNEPGVNGGVSLLMDKAIKHGGCEIDHYDTPALNHAYQLAGFDLLPQTTAVAFGGGTQLSGAGVAPDGTPPLLASDSTAQQALLRETVSAAYGPENTEAGTKSAVATSPHVIHRIHRNCNGQSSAVPVSSPWHNRPADIAVSVLQE